MGDQWMNSNRIHYVKNDFEQRDEFFVGATGDGAAPTVTCSGATRPAAPTNGIARAAGDTSRPYKWIGFVEAAHSPAAPDVSICRGSW